MIKSKRFRLFASILIAFVILIVLVRLFTLPRSYEIEYEVDGFEITEFYVKEHAYYSFSLEKDDIRYVMNVSSKYIRKKKLIDDVRVAELDEASCVLLKSKMLESYPICYKNEKFVDYDLLDESDDEFFKREEPKSTSFSYEGIDFKNTLGKKYLIWDYKGYYYIDGENQKRVEFLEKESYYNNMAYRVGEYVITPNYDEDYTISRFYVINMKNGRLSTWDIDEEISNNSYYMGDRDGLVYLVDRKNKAEYILNPRKKKIERIDEDGVGKVWNSGWEDVSMTKLASEDYYFESGSSFTSNLEEGRLTITLTGSKIPLVVSDKSVDKILDVTDQEIFYLVKDEMYSYSFRYGEKLVLKYSELNFNNVNSIFIY